jgi:hypothetical protein
VSSRQDNISEQKDGHRRNLLDVKVKESGAPYGTILEPFG